jgi:hypothetical protein
MIDKGRETERPMKARGMEAVIRPGSCEAHVVGCMTCGKEKNYAD